MFGNKLGLSQVCWLTRCPYFRDVLLRGFPLLYAHKHWSQFIFTVNLWNTFVVINLRNRQFWVPNFVKTCFVFAEFGSGYPNCSSHWLPGEHSHCKGIRWVTSVYVGELHTFTTELPTVMIWVSNCSVFARGLCNDSLLGPHSVDCSINTTICERYTAAVSLLSCSLHSTARQEGYSVEPSQELVAIG